MFMRHLRIALCSVAILPGLVSVSTTASAACGCPADGNWKLTSSRGLGESFPNATDLAADPAWQVYEFERDGVRYIQVNDRAGIVRAAAGRIGNTAWVMPIGVDADRVAVPGDALPVGAARVLYRGSDVEVVLYQDNSQARWFIRPLNTAN